MSISVFNQVNSIFKRPLILKAEEDVFFKGKGKYKYHEYGTGKTIVLLYGLFGTVKNYQKVIEEFSCKYNVIVPDLPIFELNSFATVSALTSHVYELLIELKLEKIHLVGNSLGGHIGLLLAIEHPELVRSLVLVGSSGLFENGMGDSFPKRGDYTYIKTKAETTFFDPSTATKELVDEIFETVNNKLKAVHILSLAKSTIRNNLKNQLEKIECDCCIIWGKQDAVTPPEVAYEFKKHIPHASLFWINECGHVPMLEAPKTFNEILSAFLEKHENN